MENLIIVNAYINDDKKENIMYEALLQLKKYEAPILVIANSTLSDRVVKLCDNFIYNNDNFLLPKERTPIKWFADNNETIHLYSQGNSFAIVKNLYTSLKFAAAFGFKKFMFMEFDSIIHEDDFVRIDDIFKILDNKPVFFCKTSYAGTVGYETRIHAGQVDFFLNSVPLPHTYEQWVSTPPYSIQLETLEYIFPTVFNTQVDKIHFFEGSNAEYFKHSLIDLCSTTPEISIVYNEESPVHPLLFIISTGTNYTITCNDTILESKFLPAGTINKYYLDISVDDCNVKVKFNDRTKEFMVTKENIVSYKESAIRYKL